MTKSRTGAFALALLIVALLVPGGASLWRERAMTSTGRAPEPIAASREARDAPSPATPAVAAKKERADARRQAAAEPLDQDRGPEPPSAPEPAAAEAAEAPQFDVVRVEPSGEAVVAGRSRPDSPVELLDGGKVVARGSADSAGNFVLLPPPMKPGNYDLSLRTQAAGKAAIQSKQAVAVAVPASRKGSVVVAMAEPGRPSKILSEPPAAKSSEASPPARAAGDAPGGAVSTRSAEPQAPATARGRSDTAIRSVEIENGSGFHASGKGVPGAHTELYLNDSHLASVIAGAKGGWSITVRKGLTAGHYAVRADELGPKGQVVSRAEVPFDVPAAMGTPGTPNRSERAEAGGRTVLARKDAAAAVPASRAPDLVAADAADRSPGNGAGLDGATSTVDADAIIDSVETALVIPGDNLWRISRTRLGQGRRYTQIYASNVSQIRDPQLIYPGQVFVVPGDR